MKDLSDYEVDINTDSCYGCALIHVPGCNNIFEFLTDTVCTDKILKKKEKWVRCTKENTNVGDTVRGYRNENLYTVTYIHKYARTFELDFGDCEREQHMACYEIQVKE